MPTFPKHQWISAFSIVLTLASSANGVAAVLIDVSVLGQVRSNSVSSGVLQSVKAGDSGVMNFHVDSDVFLNSATFPTRGYNIDQPSFSLMLGPATLGLQAPFPAGEMPYFVLRDNDPAVDGFFVSRNEIEVPAPVPLSDPSLSLSFVQTYSSVDILTSLDITDAAGVHGTTHQSFSSFSIASGLESVEFDFVSMTIGTVPEPSTAALVILGLAGATFQRRRKWDSNRSRL